MNTDNTEHNFEEIIFEPPVEDVLDLHHYRPADVKILLEEYIYLASRKGFESVRVIHGKGRGILRQITHSVLSKHHLVQSFKTADEGRGGWGATIVFLNEFTEELSTD